MHERPLCENCHRNVAKLSRRFCSGCYRAGVASCNVESTLRRPAAKRLVDTGLRINDWLNMLIYPDGREVCPAPPLIVGKQWLVADKRRLHILRILETKGATCSST